MSLVSEKVAVIGASRGLGYELSRALANRSDDLDLFLVARKVERLMVLTDELQSHCRNVKMAAFDLARPEQQSKLLTALEEFEPERIIYVAGGGPHGDFLAKDWKDHQWALEVSFLAPLKILHRFAQSTQILLVGSDIAENQIEPGALSYGIAKKSLRSAIEGLIKEKPQLDIRLLSPGFMDTELLPKNASPRKTHQLLQPSDVAQKTVDWLSGPKSDEWHLVLSSPPLPNT